MAARIAPIQLAVVLVAAFIIVHALVALPLIAIIIWGAVILILALLPGWPQRYTIRRAP